MFVIIYALLGFVQESQILQICYNVEHFSDILFHILICNEKIENLILTKLKKKLLPNSRAKKNK